MRPLRRIPVLLAVLMTMGIGLAGSAAFQASSTSHVAVLHSTMRGANEVPRLGDPLASGSSTVVLNANTGQVCYQIHVAGLSAPVSAGHIHMGPAGTAGPVVIPLPLTPPMTGTGPHTFAGCTTADKGLIQSIIDNPSGFYTNVHNAPFPGGAMRGQLEPLTPTGCSATAAGRSAAAC